MTDPTYYKDTIDMNIDIYNQIHLQAYKLYREINVKMFAVLSSRKFPVIIWGPTDTYERFTEVFSLPNFDPVQVFFPDNLVMLQILSSL